MKKTIQSLAIAIVFCCNFGYLLAQQDPYVTHYMFNRTQYNPAAVGANGRFCLSAMSHYQYVGFEDRTPEFYPENPGVPNGPQGKEVKNVGPKTQMLAFSAPFNRPGVDGPVNYGGLGIAFMNDKLGYESSMNIKIQAAGRLPLADGSSIALGLEYDFLQKGLDGDKLKPLAPNDPKVPTGMQQQILPNYVAGLYYNNPLTNSAGTLRDIWAGLSATNLVEQTYSFLPSTPGLPATVYSTTARHYYLMGGLTMTDFLKNPNLEFVPSIMLRRQSVTQIELSALLRFQKKLWGGLNYRSTVDAISLMLGYQISNEKSKLDGLRIGYSYDLTLSKILNVSSGSHELQLNYCFDISIPKPPVKRILNPRHLERNPNLD